MMKATKIDVSTALGLLAEELGKTVTETTPVKRAVIKKIESSKNVRFPDMVKANIGTQGYYVFQDKSDEVIEAEQQAVEESNFPRRSAQISLEEAPAPAPSPESEVAFTFAANGSKKAKDLMPNQVPNKDKNFVSFGNYRDVSKIVKSNRFFPVFIPGLSGNGKSLAVKQACAEAGKELIRLQVNEETDENELLGGFQLIAGETIWFDGPVISAMRRGSVLLLDEFTAGHPNRLMCLQSVLEGSPVYINKLNETVYPQPGFQVICTANTKGNGEDSTNKFVANGILDAAMLDRFPVWIEWNYPTRKKEYQILSKYVKNQGMDVSDETLESLTTWANQNRTLFYQGGIDEVLTTRRLVYIVDSIDLFRDTKKAIKYSINCFDAQTVDALMGLWNSIVPQGDNEESSDEDSDDDSDSETQSQFQNNTNPSQMINQ